jgi:signal transduction histidine kinase/DNA-binding NarL/FixJ family response regulator
MTLNILLADDAPLFRSFIKSAIMTAQVDANFIEVDDGKKLFVAYENYVPEITIIDHTLARTDVLDLAKKILDIHPSAMIIIFADSVNHDYVKNAKAVGVKEVLFRSIGQFAFGTLIKKLVTKKIPNQSTHEQKSRQNLINALTMSTIDKAGSTNQYVKLTNATTQKRIKDLEKLKKLGGDFNATIKNLYGTDTKPNTEKPSQIKVNSTSQNNQNFFMRELSNEQLITFLHDKIKQLNETKKEQEYTNNRLIDTVSELEETKQELVTQKEHLEEQIVMQTKNLLKSEKLVTIGELSARIAHDMRNPLNVMKNTLEILRDGLSDRLTENEIERWKRLDRGIYRMSHQIDDVMDFVKQRPLQKTRARISTILAYSLEKIPTPPNVDIHLPHSDVEVLCDSIKIEAVFVNLILNAIQAIEEKNGAIHITIHDETKDGSFVMIEIKDNGPGIPEHLKEKIFDPLFTTRQIGTGLGLTSCKRTIEAHGGTITFESKKGIGTRFFIVLPNKAEWDNIGKEQIGFQPHSQQLGGSVDMINV